MWDAVADPIVGILADRTDTRWGKFRPWILFTAVPWFVIMILAYTTPHGWSMAAMIAYAAITNTMLMTIYSMNNMPYAALGGVMTGDVNERAKLEFVPFHRGERGAIHRGRIHADAGCQICRQACGGRDRLALRTSNTAGR